MQMPANRTTYGGFTDRYRRPKRVKAASSSIGWRIEADPDGHPIRNSQRGVADSPPANKGQRVRLVTIGHALRQIIAHHFPRSRAERGDLPR